MTLLLQILLATLILIAANGNRNNHQFLSNSFPVQSDTSLFSEFLLRPKSSSTSNTLSKQCHNYFGKDYCSDDSTESNMNNKISRNFFLTLGRLDYDSKDSTQKNHQELIQLLMNEMQSSKKKRSHVQSRGCDCQIKNDVIDLGYSHFPRYLLNAVCQETDEIGNLVHKCIRGAECKPIEYKVRVLTHRTKFDILSNDRTASLLPENLRPYWKFKTVTVAAGCYCTF